MSDLELLGLVGGGILVVFIGMLIALFRLQKRLYEHFRVCDPALWEELGRPGVESLDDGQRERIRELMRERDHAVFEEPRVLSCLRWIRFIQLTMLFLAVAAVATGIGSEIASQG